MQSVQLGAEKTLGRFEFVDGSRGDLSGIYAGVASAVGTDDDDDQGRLRDEEGTLVIVDDLTALSWLGNDLAKVVKFDRALKHLCLSVGPPNPSFLISSNHCTEEGLTERRDLVLADSFDARVGRSL